MSGSDDKPPTADAAGQEPTPQPQVPRLAIILGAVGRTLITAGIVVFLFVGYQLWGTGIQEKNSQDSLSSRLDERLAMAARNPAAINDSADSTIGTDVTTTTAPGLSTEPSTAAPPTTTSTLPGGYDPDLLALFFPENGDALARLEIPAIGLDKVTVRGVNVADLRKGPGHYPRTALPGNEGNTGIAGHRTTYGAPFNRINELMPGDEIVLTSVQGGFTYRVLDPTVAYAGYEEQIDSFGPGYIVVKPSATWVLGDPVHLPTWAEEAAKSAAVRSRRPVADLVASDFVTTTAGELVNATPSTSIEFETSTPVVPATANLDLGLGGERGAIPGAILWMLGAMFFWIGSGYLGRSRTKLLTGRLAYRLVGLVPAVLFMWYAFEMIDRALPSY